MRGTQGGLCGPQGCIMGILSLRGHEEREQHISDLDFNRGALSCITYSPSQSLYSSQGYLLGEHLGTSLMSENRQGSSGYTGHHPFCLDLSHQPTWDSILATTFPLKCRAEEMSSLVISGSMNPLLFSASLTPSLSPACSNHVAEDIRFSHLS